jgi:hypothetical protein
VSDFFRKEDELAAIGVDMGTITKRSFKCKRELGTSSTVPGPYYPLGTIGNVPRACDFLRPMKEWKGENTQIKK